MPGRHLIGSVSFGVNPVTYGREFVCVYILFKYTSIIFLALLASFPGERRGRCTPIIAHSPRDAHGHSITRLGQSGPLAPQKKFLSILPGSPFQLSLQIWDVFDKCFDKSTVSPSRAYQPVTWRIGGEGRLAYK